MENLENGDATRGEESNTNNMVVEIPVPQNLSTPSSTHSKKKGKRQSRSEPLHQSLPSQSTLLNGVKAAAKSSAVLTPHGQTKTNDKGKLTGFFTPEEVQALEDFKVEFCNSNGLSGDTFNRIVQHSERTKSGDFPCDPSIISKIDFWKNVYSINPARDRRSIYRFMKRHFQSSTQKPHHWTEEQDEELISLHKRHGPKWVYIAKLIGRSDDDVVQRWKNRLEHRDTMRRGPWQVEEVRGLLDALTNTRETLKGMGHNVGKDIYELPESLISWGAVSNHIRNWRSRQQCSDKWRKIVRKVMKDRANGNPNAVFDPVADYQRPRKTPESEKSFAAPKSRRQKPKSEEIVHSDDEDSENLEEAGNEDDEDAAVSSKSPRKSKKGEESTGLQRPVSKEKSAKGEEVERAPAPEKQRAESAPSDVMSESASESKSNATDNEESDESEAESEAGGAEGMSTITNDTQNDAQSTSADESDSQSDSSIASNRGELNLSREGNTLKRKRATAEPASDNNEEAIPESPVAKRLSTRPTLKSLKSVMSKSEQPKSKPNGASINDGDDSESDDESNSDDSDAEDATSEETDDEENSDDMSSTDEEVPGGNLAASVTKGRIEKKASEGLTVKKDGKRVAKRKGQDITASDSGESESGSESESSENDNSDDDASNEEEIDESDNEPYDIKNASTVKSTESKLKSKKEATQASPKRAGTTENEPEPISESEDESEDESEGESDSEEENGQRKPEPSKKNAPKTGTSISESQSESEAESESESGSDTGSASGSDSDFAIKSEASSDPEHASSRRQKTNSAPRCHKRGSFIFSSSADIKNESDSDDAKPTEVNRDAGSGSGNNNGNQRDGESKSGNENNDANDNNSDSGSGSESERG